MRCEDLEELDDCTTVEAFKAREAAGLTRVREFAAFAAELDDADGD